VDCTIDGTVVSTLDDCIVVCVLGDDTVMCALDDSMVICALDDRTAKWVLEDTLFLCFLLEVDFVDMFGTVEVSAVVGDLL